MNARVAMTQRTSVQRVTLTSDGGGGFTESWSDVATGVPCFAFFGSTLTSRLVSSESVLEQRPTVINVRTVSVPSDTDVNPGDRLGDVTDRQGVVKFDGPLMVDTVAARRDHTQLLVRRIFV